MAKKDAKEIANKKHVKKEHGRTKNGLGKWFIKHKTLVALIVTIVFAAVHVPLIKNHEIWSDEGTSWLLSKEINPGNIFEVNSAEPHPLLWQIILAPFSQNNFPAITMNIISLILVSLAVFLLIRFAPLNWFMKLVFILSNGFFYFNPVIARDYSLIPLAICLVCMTYKNRHEKPFRYGLSLALLSQTHFLAYGLVGALFLGFIVEEFVEYRKKNLGNNTELIQHSKLKSIIKFILPLVISVATIIPVVIGSFKNQAIINGVGDDIVGLPFMQNVFYFLFGVYSNYLMPIAVVLIVILLINLFSKNPKVGIYAILSFGFWFLTMGLIYKGYTMMWQKCSILILMGLAILWILYSENPKQTKFSKLLWNSEICKFIELKVNQPAAIIITLLALLTIPVTIKEAIEDYDKPFSNSVEVSDFVNSLDDGKTVIITSPMTHDVSFHSGTMALVNNPNVDFYDYYFNKMNYNDPYLRYDTANIEAQKNAYFLSDNDLKKMLSDMAAHYDHVYYLNLTPSCSAATRANDDVLKNYKPVFETGNKAYLDVPRSDITFYQIK